MTFSDNYHHSYFTEINLEILEKVTQARIVLKIRWRTYRDKTLCVNPFARFGSRANALWRGQSVSASKLASKFLSARTRFEHPRNRVYFSGEARVGVALLGHPRQRRGACRLDTVVCTPLETRACMEAETLTEDAEWRWDNENDGDSCTINGPLFRAEMEPGI